MRIWLCFLTLSLAFVAVVVWIGGDAAALPYAHRDVQGILPARKVADAVWLTMDAGAPVEVLILLEARPNLGRAGALPTQAERASFVHAALWDAAQRAQAPLRAWLDAHSIPYRAFYIVNAIQVSLNREDLLQLASRPEVWRIVANPRVALQRPAAESCIARQATGDIEWGVSKVGAPEVWALGYTGQDVVVAGQDTGYDWDHPALKRQYLGWDGITVTHDYVWHDAIHSGGGVCGPDSPEPCDDYGHGTHTLGTMVGDDGGSNQIGVAPRARWMGCRNMDRGYGTPASYIECFEFFLAPYPVGETPDDGHANPALAPDVINNSWSCPPSEGCDWWTLQAVVEAVRAAGIWVVSSAGNAGSACSTVDEPIALYDAAYSVGATDENDNIVSFSSRGPVLIDGSGRLKPDLSAPGIRVRSSLPGGGYGYKQGTSMAAPHVAGAVALLWSARPDLRYHITATEHLINHTAAPRYSTQCGDLAETVPNNVYGWGRLDIAATLQAALRETGVLTGTVRADQGVPLAGVEVWASQSPTLTWRTWTDVAGIYRMRPLSGTYTVTGTLAGYDLEVQGEVRIRTQQTTTLPLTLSLLCEAPAGVSFTHDPHMPLSQVPVTFTGRALTGTTPIMYAWDFGDDQGIFVGNPLTHSFSAAEDFMLYRVTLTTTNACGLDTAQNWVTVTEACLPLTEPRFTVLPPAPLAQLPVTLTGRVLSGTGPITYAWDFGTGEEIRYGNPITHVFPESESLMVPYRVTMTTTNTCSQVYTQTWVMVHMPPTSCQALAGVNITASPPEPLVGTPVILTASVITGTLPITYMWDLGYGGVQARGNPITHTFPVSSLYMPYTVAVTATNVCSVQVSYMSLCMVPYVYYLPVATRDYEN